MHPLERRPLRRAVRRAGASGPGLARDYRQPGDAGIHGTEAAVGRAGRAGGVPARRAGSAAQGLSAPAADRGVCLRDVRRCRNAVARRRKAAVVGRDAGGHRAGPHGDAGPRRGQPVDRDVAARRRRGMGPADGCRRRRRRRGQRRRRRRDRHGHPGSCISVARHVRRLFRGKCHVCPKSRARRACLLPLPARHVAPDVRHVERRELPRLDRRGDARTIGSGAAGGDRGRRRQRSRAAVAALPDGRTHTAQRPARQGGLLRPHECDRPGVARPRRAGRRRVRLGRRAGRSWGSRHADRRSLGHRRRRRAAACGARSWPPCCGAPSPITAAARLDPRSARHASAVWP